MFPIIKIKTTHTNNVLKMCDKRKKKLSHQLISGFTAFRVPTTQSKKIIGIKF